MNNLIMNRDGKTWTRNKARSYPENWATETEVFDFLYGMVRMIKPEKVLEIGTFEGDTAIAMAKGLKENNRGNLLTLDVKDFGQENNIKSENLEKYVKCIKDKPIQFLAELRAGYFDMAFIDDGHSYKDCSRDLESCHRLVKKGGYILGHDVLMIDGVNQAYSNFLKRYKEQYHHIIINSYDGVFILKKL